MTLRAKALTAALFMILMMIGAGVIIIVVMTRAASLTSEALRRSSVRELQGELTVVLHEIRSDRRIYVLTGADTLPDRIRRNQAQARVLLDSIATAVVEPGQRALLGDLRAQVVDWERLSYLTPLENPTPPQIERVLSASERLFEPIAATLTRFESRQRELTESALAAGLEYRRVAQLSVSVASLLVIGTMVIVLILLKRSILNPLAALTSVAGRIAYGNVTALHPVQRSDEVGVLTNALSKMVTTVTEREAEVRRMHDELRTTLETVPAAFLLVDTAGRVRLQNQAATALIGPPPANANAMERYRAAFKLVGRDGRELPHEQWPLARALRGEVVSGEDIEVQTPLAIVPMLVAAAPVRDSAGETIGAVVAFQDVSALKAVDRMKDEFVSIVSHELRTPLTSIRGSLQLVLGDDAVADPEHLQLLRIALNNCERLIRIINDILDISKIEAGRLELHARPANVEDLVTLSIQNVAEVARAANVAFDLRLPADLPGINVDADRMVQVLVNLLSNAIKFAPRGSRVHIEGTHAAGEIVLSIVDHGSGIPADKLGLLFQKFQQVDQSAARRKGGTGLGLAITKAIVEQHGGRIDVASAMGTGTRFSITLPAVAAPHPRTTGTPGEEAVRTGDGRTVLIIDDDDEFRVVVRKQLERAGYRVVEARDGATGLHVAREVRPDLITLDLMMPGMNGWELLTRLTDDPDLKGIPVIVVSAVADQTGPLAREVAVLAKPVGQEQLLREIGEAVGSTDATILIAEDDDDMRRVLASALARRGYRVLQARDGAEALAVFDEQAIDLLVLDLKMPNVDGLAVIKRLRKTATGQRVPIIVVSGSDGSDQGEFRSMRLGANAYLAKPIDATDLARQIRQLVSGVA